MTDTTQEALPALSPAERRTMRRLERRELHRSRSLSASIALAATALAVLAPGALVLAERAGIAIPGLVLPGAAEVDAIAAQGSPVGIGVAIAALVLGIVLLGLALTRGRRARHALERDGVVVIAEDRVIAAAVSRAAARAARSTPDRARTLVSRGSAHVALRTQPGYRLDAAAAKEGAVALVDALRPKGRLRITAKEEHA